jgi:hypothetical protein
MYLLSSIVKNEINKINIKIIAIIINKKFIFLKFGIKSILYDEFYLMIDKK